MVLMNLFARAAMETRTQRPDLWNTAGVGGGRSGRDVRRE